MDGWMLSHFFQISTPPTVLSDSYESWHRCSMCPYHRNCGTDFQNFALKIFGEFFKFQIETYSVHN